MKIRGFELVSSFTDENLLPKRETAHAAGYDLKVAERTVIAPGEIIGRGHNAREELQRAVMHAEVMAIENANLSEESWRLLDCTLFVTIEPCVMCSGAIGLARIPNVVYGAKNQKFGAAGSLYDILTDERLNHRVEVETGILEDECAAIMQDFFRNRRKK